MDANRPTRNWYHFGGMAIFVVSFLFFFFFFFLGSERGGLVRDMWAFDRGLYRYAVLSQSSLPPVYSGWFLFLLGWYPCFYSRVLYPIYASAGVW